MVLIPGGRSEWEAILHQHGPSVWRNVYRLVGNRHDAEEVLQEVFLGAWRLSKRERIRNWRGLLGRLAATCALDRLRQRMRAAKPAEMPVALEALAAGDPGPEEAARANELAGQLRLALTRIPPRQAEAFCLCCMDGLKYREVARAMALKPNAVAALLHRARESLKELLPTSFLTSTVEEVGHENP